MKKYLFIPLLFISIVVLYSCANLMCTTGNGKVVKETREIPEFSEIDLTTSADIFLSKGESDKLEIEADENVLVSIKTEVIDGVLTIANDKCLLFTKSPKIYVTAEEIKAMRISGSGDIKGSNTFEADNIEFLISGSGDIALDIKSKNTEIDLSGSGDMKLSGITAKMNIFVSGSGSVQAFDLKSKETKADISGSGKVETSVSDTLTANISGSGSVSYKGAPVIVEDISGSGELTQVDIGEPEISLSVDEEIITEKTDLYEIEAKYPVIKNMQDEKAEQDINQKIKKMIEETIESFKEQAAEDPIETDLGMISGLYISHTDYYISDIIVSIAFTNDQYMAGAAHPYAYTSVFNYDVIEQKELELADLFKYDADYIGLISDYCIEQLMKETDSEEWYGDPEWIREGAGANEDNFVNWNLTQDGILITFDPYQVASYAQGPSRVVVPYTYLEQRLDRDGAVFKILNPGYFMEETEG